VPIRRTEATRRGADRQSPEIAARQVGIHHRTLRKVSEAVLKIETSRCQVLDADGNETGMFEVPAGGRRYRALGLLVKQKRLAKNALVPCVVRRQSW
jgi:ParB-like chromosome segregation protein Spo0J